MKKFFTFVLTMLIAVPVFAAGSVSDINKDAYIKHIDDMQNLRKKILALTVKSNKTAQDEATLQKLTEVFESKANNWQSYLERVADEGSDAKLPAPLAKPEHRHNRHNEERMQGEMRAKMGKMRMPKKHGHKHVCATCGKDFSTIRKEHRAKKDAKMHKHCMPMMKPCMCNMPKGAHMPPMMRPAHFCKDGKPMMPPAPFCKDGKPMMPPPAPNCKAPKACEKCKELNAGKICDKCKGMKLDICNDCKGVKTPNFCDKCKANMTRPVPPMPLMPPMKPCVCNMPKGAHMPPMMHPAHFCKDCKEGKACKADKACKKYADPNMAKANCCKAK